MKEKGMFSEYAFKKPIDDIIENPHFLIWLNVNLRIKKQSNGWIIYDVGLTPLDLMKGKGCIDFEMTDKLLHYFYESYTTDQRIDRGSRDFISLDAYFETSNAIIAKLKKQRNTNIDPTIANIIAAFDWAAMKPHTTRYRTGSVERDYQREAIRRYQDRRIELFPFDKYEGVIDEETLNQLVDLMVQLPGTLYAKMLSLSPTEMATIAPLFIYSPVWPDGTPKKGKEKVTYASVARNLNISRPAMKKRMEKICKILIGEKRAVIKKTRKTIYDRRARAEAEMYASIERQLEEKIAYIKRLIAELKDSSNERENEDEDSLN